MSIKGFINTPSKVEYLEIKSKFDEKTRGHNQTYAETAEGTFVKKVSEFLR